MQRDVTTILQLAQDGLATSDVRVKNQKLSAIAILAEEMDARTGRKDPSWWKRVQARFKPSFK